MTDTTTMSKPGDSCLGFMTAQGAPLRLRLWGTRSNSGRHREHGSLGLP